MKPYEATFSLEYLIKKMMLGKCLLCETNVRKEFKREFHILLCKKHRMEYLDKKTKEILNKKLKVSEINHL
jgi:hypothetical protein